MGVIQGKVARLTNRSGNKYVKRMVNRLWRRMAKKDPDGAPRRRPTKGWVD